MEWVVFPEVSNPREEKCGKARDRINNTKDKQLKRVELQPKTTLDHLQDTNEYLYNSISPTLNPTSSPTYNCGVWNPLNRGEPSSTCPLKGCRATPKIGKTLWWFDGNWVKKWEYGIWWDRMGIYRDRMGFYQSICYFASMDGPFIVWCFFFRS